jgi:hypothetical protein
MLDGTTISVTQERQYERVYTGSGFGMLSRESWLTFNLPAFSSKPITWHESLHPIVLNVFQGRLYVVGIPPTAREQEQYGAYAPPYVGFIFSGGKWTRIAFSQIPRSIYATNMRIDNQPPLVDRISLACKAVEQNDPEYPLPLKAIDPAFGVN